MKIALLLTGILVVPNAALYAVAVVPTSAESSSIWDNTIAVLTMAGTAIGVMLKLMFSALKLIQSAQAAIDGVHKALDASRRRDEETLKLREQQMIDFMRELNEKRASAEDE